MLSISITIHDATNRGLSVWQKWQKPKDLFHQILIFFLYEKDTTKRLRGQTINKTVTNQNHTKPKRTNPVIWTGQCTLYMLSTLIKACYLFRNILFGCIEGDIESHGLSISLYRHKLLEFRTSFYETISSASEFLVQGISSTLDFTRAWYYRDSNSQPLTT